MFARKKVGRKFVENVLVLELPIMLEEELEVDMMENRLATIEELEQEREAADHGDIP